MLLSDVSITVNQKNFEDVKYFLLNVGLNDIDEKDHIEVFQDMEILTNEIREKYPGIKFIISEFIQRNDSRNTEVQLFNKLLTDYALNNEDITVARHGNLKDATWSMYRDAKHIKESKVAKFAANLIRALKTAYDIREKSELFMNEKFTRYQNSSMRIPESLLQWDRGFSNMQSNDNNNKNNLRNNLEKNAGYYPMNNETNTMNVKVESKNDLLHKLQEVIQKLMT